MRRRDDKVDVFLGSARDSARLEVRKGTSIVPCLMDFERCVQPIEMIVNCYKRAYGDGYSKALRYIFAHVCRELEGRVSQCKPHHIESFLAIKRFQ